MRATLPELLEKVKVMEKISIFGSKGFIGSNFQKLYPEISIPIESGDFKPKSSKVLYLRSTVSNYSEPEENIQINLVNLMKVLRNLKKNDFFVMGGSWFSYGLGDFETEAARENDYNKTLGFYSSSKLCAESFVETYCKNNGINFQILRFSNIIGPGDKFSAQKNALQFLVEKLKVNEKIELYNNGNFWRNYLHVEELCRAIKFLIKYGKKDEKYNIGFYQNVKFSEIINYCAKKLNSKSEIVSRAPSEFHSIIQTPSFRMSVEKLKKLGFEWEYSMSETLDKILE